jgi:hypothetical protein
MKREAAFRQRESWDERSQQKTRNLDSLYQNQDACGDFFKLSGDRIFILELPFPNS